MANGNMSLYLDVYVKGVRNVESLGLYLVPETTPIDRQHNNHVRQVAEKIKAERILAL
ncbi:MAG: Arm DNA-binding domain-containing protein [Eubacterium sp.]